MPKKNNLLEATSFLSEKNWDQNTEYATIFGDYSSSKRTYSKIMKNIQIF